MTLDEALEDDVVVTAKAARREVANHCADWSEFVEIYGSFDEYHARDVLAWLGY